MICMGEWMWREGAVIAVFLGMETLTASTFNQTAADALIIQGKPPYDALQQKPYSSSNLLTECHLFDIGKKIRKKKVSRAKVGFEFISSPSFSTHELSKKPIKNLRKTLC